MAEFDVDKFITRFRERAEAVQRRNLPPVAGPERKSLIEQAESDFLDYSLVADAQWAVEDGYLTLRIPLSG